MKKAMFVAVLVCAAFYAAPAAFAQQDLACPVGNCDAATPPGDEGVCDGHGGIVGIDSQQTSDFVVTHYVTCADGTVVAVEEETIQSAWTDPNTVEDQAAAADDTGQTPAPDSWADPGPGDWFYDVWSGGWVDDGGGC